MSRRLIEEVRRAGGELATESAARRAVDAVTTAIRNVAAGGDAVTIRGFGTFRRKVRDARKGRNPRTGETIHISAKETLTFKSTTD